MQTAHAIERYVARERNALRVDFNRDADPPAPWFPAPARYVNTVMKNPARWTGHGTHARSLPRPLRPGQDRTGYALATGQSLR